METNEQKQEQKLITGKIIFISEEGWGHIITKDIPFEKVFFHWTALRNDTLRFKDIEEGMKVEFISFEHPEKGWRAINIKVMGNEE